MKKTKSRVGYYFTEDYKDAGRGGNPKRNKYNKKMITRMIRREAKTEPTD